MASHVLSAGLLLFRGQGDELEVLLAHPGGPYFRNKDDGHWSIPKGLPEGEDDLAEVARREWSEEMGLPAPPPDALFPLGTIQQKGGKTVHAFGCRGDVPPDFEPRSNLVTIEWPPRSGRKVEIPEVDRATFFSLTDARRKIKDAQAPFLDRLVAHLAQT